jgi:hypothetical protein
VQGATAIKTCSTVGFKGLTLHCLVPSRLGIPGWNHAEVRRRAGKSISVAAIQAAGLRFRPVMNDELRVHLRPVSPGDCTREPGRSPAIPSARPCSAAWIFLIPLLYITWNACVDCPGNLQREGFSSVALGLYYLAPHPS